MIERRITKDAAGVMDLCETYSTAGRRLMQEETGVIYGASVVDVVAGYDQDGAPVSRYTYHETEYPDETEGT